MAGLTKYHVGVVVAGALLCFGPATMVLNLWAIFLVPVSGELGVSSNIFALQPSIIYLACALVAPWAGRLIDRFDLKAVLTGASVLGGCSVALCGLCTHLWQFFALGACEGCAGVVLMFLMLPNLHSRWFAKGMGTAVGICIAMAGFGGALWAYLGGAIIVAAGWRVAYVTLGCIALALSLPASLLLIRNHPEDVGVLPYGAQGLIAQGEDTHGVDTLIRVGEQTPTSDTVSAPSRRDAVADAGAVGESGGASDAMARESGVSAKAAFGSSAFVLLVIAVSATNGIIGVANLLPTYVYYLGETGAFAMSASQVVMAASTIALCTQIAQACGKILFGLVADRNAVVAFVATMVCGIMAVFCFLLGYEVPAIVFAGGALFGALFSVTDVLSPVLARGFFGDREYSRIYARITSLVNFAPAFSIFLFASLSQISWALTFITAGACLVISLICGVAASRAARRLRVAAL